MGSRLGGLQLGRFSLRNTLLFISIGMTVLFVSAITILYTLFIDRMPSYVTDGQGRLIFFIGAVLGAQLLGIGVLLYQPAFNVVQRYFTEKDSPFNLAIFRIVFFAAFFAYVLIDVKVNRIIFFAGLPSSLLFPTPGLGPIITRLPINPVLATIAVYSMLTFCIMAMVGLFTRTSALLTVVFGLYALGIPQFYGKVNHYHHLIWFAAILAMSRCGDVLSLDSIRAAWRRADRGALVPPANAIDYALPIRLIWLLMGIMYLFPGLWKIYSGGTSWVFSDNLKYRLYQKWFELGGWMPMPLFRIDGNPPLLYIGALFTLAIEVGFIFLIFLPRLRPLAALGGMMFHTMVLVTMRIWFWSLQICYVSFVNWKWLFEFIGKRLFREDMRVIYDGNCALCRRTVGAMRAFDLFGRVTYINALDQQALKEHGLAGLSGELLKADLHALVGERRFAGFAAYQALAKRIPFMWPLLPFLYLPPVVSMGNRLYRTVADTRTATSAPSSVAVAPKARRTPVAAVGVFLLVVNFLFGAVGVAYAWPFACYPTFQEVVGPTLTTLRIVAYAPDGSAIPLNEAAIKQKFAGERWAGLIRWTLRTKDSPGHANTLSALTQVLLDNDPGLHQGDRVEIFEATYSTLPKDWGQPPISEKPLIAVKL